jgi:chemotaxis protein histidine kinase CheA
VNRSRYRSLYVTEARRCLAEARAGLIGEPDARGLLRAFHTFKGMSSTMELAAPVQLAHAAEDLCVAVVEAGADVEAKKLLAEAATTLAAQVAEVEAGREPDPDASLERALRERAGARAAAPVPVWDPEEDTSDAPTADSPGDAFAAVLAACARLRTHIVGDEGAGAALDDVVDRVRALHAEHESLRGTPFSSIEAPLRRRLRTVSADTGRRAILTVEGGDLRVDPAVLGSLLAALLHLLHNAVAHGIEPPALRGRKGPVGQLHLHATREDHTLVVTLSDDGRGLDAAALQRLAGVAVGAPAPPRPEPLPALPRVALLAGRGEGVAAARALIERLGGALLLTSTPGLGTRAVLHLPLSADAAAGPARPPGPA